jgi:hypothetical protein
VVKDIIYLCFDFFVFGICLVFGAWVLEFVWFLVLGFWNLFGIWCLDFGISPGCINNVSVENLLPGEWRGIFTDFRTIGL